jgi:host factor-I protein
LSSRPLGRQTDRNLGRPILIDLSVCGSGAELASCLLHCSQKQWRGGGPCLSPNFAAQESGNKRNEKMAAERTQNLQDTFLNYVRKSKIPLTIFLVNGVKLQGVVTWFDNFCVLLRRDGHSQLVYKHAISTIMPGAPIQMFETEEGGEKP